MSPQLGPSPIASDTPTEGPGTTPGATPTATNTPAPDGMPPEPGAGRIYAPYVANRALAGNVPAAGPALTRAGGRSFVPRWNRPRSPRGVAGPRQCLDLVRNGGFETSDVAERSASGARRASGTTMHGGISAAMPGGRDNASGRM